MNFNGESARNSRLSLYLFNKLGKFSSDQWIADRMLANSSYWTRIPGVTLAGCTIAELIGLAGLSLALRIYSNSKSADLEFAN